MNKATFDQNQPAQQVEVATMAGGCFWCLEPIFADFQGVIKVEVGYAGGEIDHPSYQLVCTGATGHAEAVQVTYDPQVTSFKELLEVFFTIHDPTTLDRQGADVGTQYRSAIFYHDESQKETARQVIKEIEATGIWDKPIVTQLSPYTKFFKAEGYHQGYFNTNPMQTYCRVVIAPKVAKFRQKYATRLKSATVHSY